MHPIWLYMEKHGLSQKQFADLVGLSPQSVNDLLWDRYPCGANASRKIQRGTKGEISVQELVDWTPLPRKRTARRRAGAR